MGMVSGQRRRSKDVFGSRSSKIGSRSAMQHGCLGTKIASVLLMFSYSPGGRFRRDVAERLRGFAYAASAYCSSSGLQNTIQFANERRKLTRRLVDY